MRALATRHTSGARTMSGDRPRMKPGSVADTEVAGLGELVDQTRGPAGHRTVSSARRRHPDELSLAKLIAIAIISPIEQVFSRHRRSPGLSHRRSLPVRTSLSYLSRCRSRHPAHRRGAASCPTAALSGTRRPGAGRNVLPGDDEPGRRGRMAATIACNRPAGSSPARIGFRAPVARSGPRGRRSPADRYGAKRAATAAAWARMRLC